MNPPVISESRPLVSVVIASNQDGLDLQSSLDSIVDQQSAPDWECLIVSNGSFHAGEALKHRLRTDRRFRLLHSRLTGLTEALRLGCNQARGSFIARLDVGDAMEPLRLCQQVQALGDNPTTVLCSSAVQVCGPRWEALWVNRGTEKLAGIPTRVDVIPASAGLAMDIPHHSAVMFRSDTYRAVGGYRSQFYFGQDWDLWYRLARAGCFVHLPLVLTRVRLFSVGLSSRHWREQREIARLSRACYQARSKEKSESKLLHQASEIRPSSLAKRQLIWDGRRAEGSYFIAESLRRNRDRRCRGYFRDALRFGFWKPRIWIRAFQSLFLFQPYSH